MWGTSGRRKRIKDDERHCRVCFFGSGRSGFMEGRWDVLLDC